MVVAVCLLNVIVAWWLDRIRRTIAAAEALMSSYEVRAMLFIENDHKNKVATEQQYWLNYQRDVLRPGLDAIERFAMPTINGLPCVYSRWVIRRMGCQALIGIWENKEVQHFVKVMRERSCSPKTIYENFERLVEWLRAHPL